MPTGKATRQGLALQRNPAACLWYLDGTRTSTQRPQSWPGEPRMIFPSFTASLDAARRPLLLSKDWPCRLLSKTSFRIALELGLRRRPPKDSRRQSLWPSTRF